MKEYLQQYAAGINQCLDNLPWEKMIQLVELLSEKIKERKQIFVFGNGACAAASSHFVCDLAKGLVGEGIPRVKALSLNDCIPLMTAWSNDESYEIVFKEQLVNLLEGGGVVIGISASGNSPNVLRAIEFANSRNASTVGLIGMGGGKLKSLVKLPILIQSDSYEIIEDVIVSVTHMLKLALIKKLSK